MRNSDVVWISKRLSYVLRHRPDAAGIELDTNGWVDVEALALALSTTNPGQVEVRNRDGTLVVRRRRVRTTCRD